MHWQRKSGWKVWTVAVGAKLAVGCASVAAPQGSAPARVRAGITVLLEDSLHLIRGRSVGLLTNQTGVDERSGLVVHSLYTVTTVAPPDSTLRDLDVLVVDLQDIGTRARGRMSVRCFIPCAPPAGITCPSSCSTGRIHSTT